MVKDDREQQLMIEASIINDKAMNEMIKQVALDLSEVEVTSKLKDIYQKLGATDISFDTIVAYGKKWCKSSS